MHNNRETMEAVRRVVDGAQAVLATLEDALARLAPEVSELCAATADAAVGVAREQRAQTAELEKMLGADVVSAETLPELTVEDVARGFEVPVGFVRTVPTRDGGFRVAPLRDLAHEDGRRTQPHFGRPSVADFCDGGAHCPGHGPSGRAA